MSTSRRHFLKSATAAGIVAAQKVSANDRLQIALIGAGGMGSGDTRYQLAFPGVALVAVCDVYDGRLARAKEVWRSEEHTSELQSQSNLVCRLLLEKKKKKIHDIDLSTENIIAHSYRTTG